MRKIVSILIMLFSVLTMWGEKMQFTYEDAIETIDDLRVQQNIVVEEALKVRVIKDSKEEMDSTLTKAFDTMDKIVLVYPKLDKNKRLQIDALALINDFCIKYRTAIINSEDDPIIKIGSRSFLQVCEDSTPRFESFLDKVQEYLNKMNEEGSDDDEEEKGLDNPLQSNVISSIWLWILLGLVIISLGLNIYLLNRVNYLNKRINRHRQDIDNIGKESADKIKAEKTSAYRGIPASSYVAQPILQPQLQPVNRKNHPPSTTTTSSKASTKTSPDTKTPTGKESSKLIHLYGVAKTNSSFPEFYKVSEDESVDKAFVLVIENKDDDTAEYSISPIMSADFKKSVIQDRETFLPPLFCEKNIESASPTSIEVVSKGKAHKVDGKWQVRERMIIRLV